MRAIMCCSRLLFVMAVCVTLVGCGGRGSKLTQANYDRISEGMTLQQVEEILGKGDVVSEGPQLDGVAKIREKHKDHKAMTWEWKPKSVVIIFVDDKVVFKSKGGF